MREYDLKQAIAGLHTQRMNFSLYRGDDADQIVISGKPPGTTLLAQIEKDCGKTKRIMKGLCFMENGKLCFATRNAPAPAWEMLITKVLKERKCSQYLPIGLKQLGPKEFDEVSVDELPPGAAPAAPAAPPAPTAATKPAPANAPAAPAANGPTQDEWEAYRASIMPQLRAAIAAPATKVQVTKIVIAASAKEKEGKYGEAMDIFRKLAGALNLPAPAPAAPPPPPAAEAPPAPPAPGADTPPPAPPRPVRKPKAGNLQAALNKLTPIIKAAIAGAPDRKAEVLSPIVDFQKQIKTEPEEARATLRKIGTMLKEVLAAAK